MQDLPLSELLRPKTLTDLVGQEHLVSEDGILTKIIQSKKPLSILLYGPPGTGKTTIAKLYAQAFNLPFVALSAVFTSTQELKKLIQDQAKNPLFSQKTILFIDELHRFNKSQQDAFLPYLENGSWVLIGATTENPSFSLNNALLSRLRVLTLNPLKESDLEKILQRYEKLFHPLNITPAAREKLLLLAQGDARYLLNLIENLETLSQKEQVDEKLLEKWTQKKASLYDKHDEYHYNLISALHKSVRGSDPQASLYWFCRMLEGGEDPLYIARRLVRMATEDIGLADPQALTIALNGYKTYTLLGSPEGELALAEVVIYLALSPKSNTLYTAYGEAKKVAANSSHLSPPKTILNAPTSLMKDLGYGDGYVYDHDTKDGFSGQDYFPETLLEKTYYFPIDRGFERDLKKRLEYFTKLKSSLAEKKPS